MRFFKAFINLFNQTIYSLENSKAPFIYFVFTFFFAVTLRNFLEMFSSYFPLDPLDFIHTYLSYVSLAMILILLLCLFTRTDILKIAKTVLPSFIILNSVPILDLILSKGKGYEITYLFPGIHNNLILRFFTFFGDFPGMGITPGMRIEIGLGLVGSFIYFYFKNLKLIKSLFFTILVYVCIFSYTALPFFITGTLKLIKLKPVSSDLLFINFYLFIIFLTGTLLIYVTKRKYFQIIIKDLMPLRILHYELLFLLGLILGMKYKFFTIDCINIFYFIFVPISIAFAWLFSVIINNIEDCEIDKVSNKERPFVKSEINI